VRRVIERRHSRLSCSTATIAVKSLQREACWAGGQQAGGNEDLQLVGGVLSS